VAVIARLRADEPVSARGVALVRILLVDGGSPAYAPCRPGALRAWAATALAALTHEFELAA
jgi:hypothetical protein